MKYTAGGGSRVTNIARAQGEADHDCYICHETLTRVVYFHTNRVAVL